VEEAVQILGVSTIKALALSIYVFSVFESQRHGDFPMDELWKHSLGTGFRARRIGMKLKLDPAAVDAAFTGGVLHDVGKLVLAFGAPALWRKSVELATVRRLPGWQAELQSVGANHAQMGGYMLGLWGLPSPIVEAVAWHHAPSECQPVQVSALTAVHVANALENGRASGAADLSPLLDRSYLEQLDLLSCVRDWSEEGASG
jgi:HD-like signal output (HDOD) protein